MLQSRVEELESAVNDMAVKSKGLEYENVRLRRLLYKSLHFGINADEIDQYNFSGIIMEEATKELSLSIHCLELSTRVKNGLKALDILTLADLLREIRDYKMQRIKEKRMLGKKSIEKCTPKVRPKTLGVHFTYFYTLLRTLLLCHRSMPDKSVPTPLWLVSED